MTRPRIQFPQPWARADTMMWAKRITRKTIARRAQKRARMAWWRY